MFNIIYLLFYCIYQWFEGATEAMTAMKGRWNSEVDGAKYHTWRTGEDVGIHGISLLVFINRYGLIYGVINYFFIMLIGTRIYEFVFCHVAHGNMMFEKTWKWEFKIPFTNKIGHITYMKPYQKVIVLIIGIIGFIITLIK